MEKILLDELSNIISAYKEGRTLQFYTSYGGFKDVSAEEFDIEKWYKKPKKFCIKPEPKYRPFANAEECWVEMCKHQPFGWVKLKDTQKFLVCKAFGNLLFFIGIEDKPYNYKEVLRDYTFADGIPFGVKVEE